MRRAGTTADESIVERSRWLISLRWIAIAGVILTAITAGRVFKIPLPVAPFCVITAVLIAYNLIFTFLIARLRNGFANLQISLDLACLAALIHFSGGIENPFLFYFIFHMIIAGILLSRRAAILQATFAAVLFLAMVILEYTHTLAHYCLGGFIIEDQHGNLLYIAGVSFVFISTLYIAVYMATSIAKRLKRREASLGKANALLNEKDRIKSEYVLRVTHDIKEHLSAIQSCVETVAGGIAGELNEKQANLLQRADERTAKLMAFVKALVEITRIKLAREIEFDYFSLKDTIESAINFVDTKARDKSIIINSSISPAVDMINGAQVYIEETIANILANAVKYTSAGGRVDIDVEDDGGNVLIRVRDTGIGIPKGEIGKLFEEFYRATNARLTEKSGTGLGLAIARQVVARHGGKIWAESEEGVGSVFSIILPKGGAQG
ncbi:MAG: HAMP domain-containing sensor histidine kinase [Candidatus Omnitrophota bacterium]|nr:HAMP domain-containing sensor histidine kinase [Candidatus Omnitrophota bacterium]